VQAAIAAVDAGRLVEHALSDPALLAPLRSARHVDVVAAGKAAAPMLTAFAGSSPVPIRSMLGVGPGMPSGLPDGAAWQASAHPVPDERSVAAARRVLEVAEATSPADLLVVLLSGGASAMMAMPASTDFLSPA